MAAPARRARARGARKPPARRGWTTSTSPARYRRVCQQLALAQRRGYSARVLERLEALAQQGHDVLYRPPAPRWQRLLGFFGRDYPRLVRRHARFMWLSAALFFLPLLAMLVLLQFRPELVHSVFDTAQIRDFERMYDPASPSHALGRESGTNLQMFGYYIFNNISIGFRTFASGLLFGVGAIVVLVINGIVIGTVAGHLTAIGYGDPFWRFVAGHSGFELSAIVLAGGAGPAHRLGAARAGAAVAAAGAGGERQGWGADRVRRVRASGHRCVRRGVLVVDRLDALDGEVRRRRRWSGSRCGTGCGAEGRDAA